MKALVLQALNQVSYTDVALPTPTDEQLLIKTAASTLCTSDLHDIAENPFGAPLPLTMGHEGAGTVVQVGAAVSGFQVGDRVVTHPVHPCGACRACQDGMAHLCEAMGHFGLNMPGTFAEYYVVRADRARKLPTAVPFAVAALFEPLCVCLEALAQAHLKPGDHLLIVGDGPFGLLMAHLAQRMALGQVVLAGHQPFRLAHAGQQTITVNTAATTNPGEAMLAANGGVDYDAVILATDSKVAFASSLPCVRRKGRFVVFASLLGDTPIDLMLVQTKELEVVGACNDAERLDDALAYLVAEHATLAPLITHTFPLEAYAEAVAIAAQGQAEAIKVAFQIA